MKIAVGKCLIRRKPHWYVSRLECGKRKRSFFTSKADADAQADQFRDQLKRAGQVWLSLPAHERDRLMQAYAKASERGIDLIHLLETAVQQPAISGPLLPIAIDEIVSAKEKAGRSRNYTRNLGILLKQFARARDHVTIDKLTLADVESFLDSKPLASRSTLRARLSTLFKFAIRRGYRIDNPCQRLEPITVPHKTPDIFTLPQIKQCLAALKSNRRALPWFILTTFCGLRPEEADKTTRADIHIAEGWIKIEAQTSKVRQRRVVYPRPEAIRLLARALPRGRLPIHPRARRRVIHKLREKLKFQTWPRDITRHTAASYWLALKGSHSSHIADQLGHSESVLRKNYKALVTNKQAKEFWDYLASCAKPH